MLDKTPVTGAVSNIGAAQSTVRAARISPTVELFDRLPDAACVSINDAVLITGRSRSSIYRDHDVGVLPFVKFNKSTRIQVGDLRKYLSGEVAQ